MEGRPPPPAVVLGDPGMAKEAEEALAALVGVEVRKGGRSSSENVSGWSRERREERGMAVRDSAALRTEGKSARGPAASGGRCRTILRRRRDLSLDSLGWLCVTRQGRKRSWKQEVDVEKEIAEGAQRIHSFLEFSLSIYVCYVRV
jgi:hypothetical protein